MNEFFVYMYSDLNDVPFWIGKGKDNRYRVSQHLGKGTSNRLLKNKIRKVGIKNTEIQFIKENLTEEEAFCIERFWIKLIGRRDLKTGTLCNLSDGGEGMSGHFYNMSEKHKLNISKALKGKKHTEEHRQNNSKALRKYNEIHLNPFAGKKHTEETKRKIGDANRGKPAWNKGKKRVSFELVNK